MISNFQIQAFLKKQADDHDWLKSLTIDEINQEIAKLNPQPNLPAELELHQKICFLLGVAYPGFLFMVDMGEGKTLIALCLLRYFIKTGLIKKWAIILVPTDEVAYGWGEEIQKWMPELPYCMLEGSSKNKWTKLENFNTGLVIGTYVGMAAMMSELRNRQRLTPEGKQRKRRVLLVELLQQFLPNVDALVMDESSKIGNVNTLSYEFCSKLSQHAKVRLSLVGRPFGRDPILLWSQFFLADRGQTLTGSFGLFREVFFTKKKSWFGGPNTYEYKYNRTLHKDLSRIIKHRSIRFESQRKEKPTRIIKKLPIPPDMKEYYNKIVDEILQGSRSFSEIESCFVKQRQICSGYLSLKGDNSEKVNIEFKTNPKMSMLLDLIDDLPEGSKFIIFYYFTHSGQRICEELKKRKIKHGWLWAGTKDWDKMKLQFDTDPNFRGIVNQCQKGSYGLNLQAANYSFYYESPTDPIEREQSERRIDRKGQTKPIFHYDLVMRGDKSPSVEESILAYHKEGNNLFQAMVNGRALIQKV